VKAADWVAAVKADWEEEDWVKDWEAAGWEAEVMGWAEVEKVGSEEGMAAAKWGSHPLYPAPPRTTGRPCRAQSSCPQ
jgi:hypothetical protein